jgi:hypothetical protein
MPEEQPKEKTEIAIPDMYAALKSAWPSVIGEDPTDTAVLALMAQWALETANGEACFNYNIGNFKAYPQDNPSQAWFAMTTTENVGGVTTTVPGAKFQAFASLDDGVRSYLSAMHGRFGAAWQYVESGDLQAFAKALHDQGYYTGIPPNPVDTYAAGLAARRAVVVNALGLGSAVASAAGGGSADPDLSDTADNSAMPAAGASSDDGTDDGSASS